MTKTLHDIKLKTLKNIFAGCLDFKYDIIDNYDFTQPDGCDESGSGGCWDLAGVVADNLLDKLFELNDNRNDRDLETVYYQTHADLQSLLYNMFCEYKDERDDDDDDDETKGE